MNVENSENGGPGEYLSPQEKAAISANPFLFTLNSLVGIEKLRVASQVREKHLERQGRKDENTVQIHERLVALEEFVTDLLAGQVESHQAYPWFSRIKGVGRENIGKVLGFLDIQKAGHISSFWKFAGYSVNSDNKAPRAVKGGGKLEYNKKLRVMCYRLGVSLLKAGGKFVTEVYQPEKERLQRRFQEQGVKIVPASALPQEKGKKYEPEGVISEGHVHMMAFRKMIKVFLACLWLTWRKAEGMPLSQPWVITHGGHDGFIDPWSLCDRPEKKSR
jgi:hypothetical protein